MTTRQKSSCFAASLSRIATNGPLGPCVPSERTWPRTAPGHAERAAPLPGAALSFSVRRSGAGAVLHRRAGVAVVDVVRAGQTAVRHVDAVVVGVGVRHGHGQRGARLEALTLQQRERQAGVVATVLGAVRLSSGRTVLHGRLHVRLEALLALLEEHRNGDRGQDADDDDDDQELDQGEAPILLLHRLANPSEHCSPSLRRCEPHLHVPLAGPSVEVPAEATRLTLGPGSRGFATPPCDGCALVWPCGLYRH